MHPIVMQALASQRTAELQAAAVSCHRPPVGTGSSIRQRIGWALVQVGLRLAVHHARA